VAANDPSCEISLILFDQRDLSTFQFEKLLFVKLRRIMPPSLFIFERAGSAATAQDVQLDDDKLAAKITIFPNPSQEPP
jgi:hypothetical protein